MHSTSELIDKSLNGKWISLARQWLEENGPCSFETYFAAVRPLMPTHIIHKGNKRASQELLTKKAAKRIGIIDAQNMIFCKPNLSTKLESPALLKSLLETQEHVAVKDVRHIKWSNHYLHRWYSEGKIDRVAKGIYRKKPSMEAGS